MLVMLVSIHHAHVVAGFVASAISLMFAKIISTVEHIPKNWWEASPYIIFIGCLLYAVFHLWKTIIKMDEERSKRDQETIDTQRKLMAEQKEAIDNLANTLERLASCIKENTDN